MTRHPSSSSHTRVCYGAPPPRAVPPVPPRDSSGFPEMPAVPRDSIGFTAMPIDVPRDSIGVTTWEMPIPPPPRDSIGPAAAARLRRPSRSSSTTRTTTATATATATATTTASTVMPLRPDEVPMDLVCSICLSVPPDPCIVPHCSHVFCRGCIHDSLAHNKESCPLCRASCRSSDICSLEAGSPLAHRIWSNLGVQCQYHEHGCSWTGSLGDYDSHRSSCRRAPTRSSSSSSRAHHHQRTTTSTKDPIPEDDLEEEEENPELARLRKEKEDLSYRLQVLEAQNDRLNFRLTASGVAMDDLHSRLSLAEQANRTLIDEEVQELRAQVEILNERLSIQKSSWKQRLRYWAAGTAKPKHDFPILEGGHCQTQPRLMDYY